MTLERVAHPEPIRSRGLVTLDEIRDCLATIALELQATRLARAAAPAPAARRPRGDPATSRPCPICATPFVPRWKPGGQKTMTCSRRCGATVRRQRTKEDA